MQQRTTWPSTEEAFDIHTRLCEGDPVAPSDLAVAYLDMLAMWLARANPRLDPHLCDQAAEDAILSLIKCPQSFKPDKSPLDAYLRMSAKADLQNALGREMRHAKRRASLEVVELFGSDRNLNREANDPALIVEREEDERETQRFPMPLDIEREFSGEDQRVIELMLQGVRRTDAFARVLNITEMADHDQRRAVKRIKDRIKRRIQRARGKT